MNNLGGQAANNGPGGGKTTRTVDSPWVERLLTLHRQVKDAVAKAGLEAIESKNAKGDDVKRFDLAANDAALAVLRQLQVPAVVDSEECGRRIYRVVFERAEVCLPTVSAPNVTSQYGGHST